MDNSFHNSVDLLELFLELYILLVGENFQIYSIQITLSPLGMIWLLVPPCRAALPYICPEKFVLHENLFLEKCPPIL